MTTHTRAHLTVWIVTKTDWRDYYDHPITIAGVFSNGDDAQRWAMQAQAKVAPYDESYEVEAWDVDDRLAEGVRGVDRAD